MQLLDRWQLVLKWIGTCLVFFALPTLLVSYGLDLHWNTIEQDSIEQSYQLLDEILLTLRRKEDTPELLSKFIKLIHQKADSAPDRLAILRRGIASMKHRFPGVFRFTVTDSRGETIPSLTDGTPSRLVVKRLFETVIANEDSDSMRKHLLPMWALFQTFIGREATIDRMEKSNRSLTEVTFMEEGRWFGYSTSSNGGIFVHATQTPDWPLLAIRDLMRRFLSSRAGKLGVEVGIQDLTTQASLTPELAMALGEYQRTTQQHQHISDRLFTIMPFTATSRLWASRPRSVAVDYNRSRLYLTAVSAAILAFLTIFSYLVMIQGMRFQFPIRWRLVVLFVFASGLPLAVILFAGWDYLNQKYKARIRQTHDDGERALRAFDARFPQMRGVMEQTFGRLVNSCHSGDKDLQSVLRVMHQLHKRYLTNNVILYDENGDIAKDLNFSEASEQSIRSRNMMGVMGARIIANLNHETYSGKLDTASLIIESISQGENPITHLTRDIGKVLNMSMAGNETWMLMLPVRNPTGRVTHVMLGYWRKYDLERVYLSKYFMASQRAIPGLRIYGWTPRGGGIPERFSPAARLKTFLADIELRQTTLTTEIRDRGEYWLVTGIKPKEMVHHLLLALVPKAPIIEEMRLLGNRLWLFTGVMTAMSIFLGINLSQRFLKPIGELSKGVDAIRQRRFAHRVPDVGQDELGDLARTFNGVMEGLADLEVAKIVQESLFPANEVKAGEYSIYGESHTMTALGGDYFDLQQLSDGRVLVLVGDVSGHGVPAALVMAMAKALVERESELSSTPDSILAVIHRVFLRTLKRKRMMTCFLGILDTVTHQFQYANAGHNYPVKFRNGVPPLFLEINGMPLGSMKKNVLKLAETDIQPGDRIVFYTDGIVEAKLNGQEIGYQRMSGEIGRRLCDDARKSCERIFEWHRGLTAGSDQQDDITLLVLTRISSRTAKESRPEQV